MDGVVDITEDDGGIVPPSFSHSRSSSFDCLPQLFFLVDDGDLFFEALDETPPRNRSSQDTFHLDVSQGDQLQEASHGSGASHFPTGIEPPPTCFDRDVESLLQHVDIDGLDGLAALSAPNTEADVLLEAIIAEPAPEQATESRAMRKEDSQSREAQGGPSGNERSDTKTSSGTPDPTPGESSLVFATSEVRMVAQDNPVCVAYPFPQGIPCNYSAGEPHHLKGTSHQFGSGLSEAVVAMRLEGSDDKPLLQSGLATKSVGSRACGIGLFAHPTQGALLSGQSSVDRLGFQSFLTEKHFEFPQVPPSRFSAAWHQSRQCSLGSLLIARTPVPSPRGPEKVVPKLSQTSHRFDESSNTQLSQKSHAPTQSRRNLLAILQKPVSKPAPRVAWSRTKRKRTVTKPHLTEPLVYSKIDQHLPEVSYILKNDREITLQSDAICRVRKALRTLCAIPEELSDAQVLEKFKDEHRDKLKSHINLLIKDQNLKKKFLMQDHLDASEIWRSFVSMRELAAKDEVLRVLIDAESLATPHVLAESISLLRQGLEKLEKSTLNKFDALDNFAVMSQFYGKHGSKVLRYIYRLVIANDPLVAPGQIVQYEVMKSFLFADRKRGGRRKSFCGALDVDEANKRAKLATGTAVPLQINTKLVSTEETQTVSNIRKGPTNENCVKRGVRVQLACTKSNSPEECCPVQPSSLPRASDDCRFGSVDSQAVQV
ncbi:hypothetical protein ACA910_007668 [Epithemia clementina (nom. ined.)]